MEGLVLLIVFLISLMATASLLVLIAVAPPVHDRGTRLFLYPLTPLFIVSFLGFFVILHTINPGIGYETGFFIKAVSVLRLWLGLGWVIFCHEQYRFHGIVDFRQKLSWFFVLLTLANSIFYLFINMFFLSIRYGGSVVSSLIMSLSAIYAAIAAVLILIKTNKLSTSAWAGLVLAVIGLTLYPLIFVADALHYHYPGVDPKLPLWMIFNPHYLIIICCVLFPLLYLKKNKTTESALPDQKGNAGFYEPFDCLSEREMETVLCLSNGMSYKEIAAKMDVSVASVQTYILRSYRKLHIHNRKQLDVLFSTDL